MRTYPKVKPIKLVCLSLYVLETVETSRVVYNCQWPQTSNKHCEIGAIRSLTFVAAVAYCASYTRSMPQKSAIELDLHGFNMVHDVLATTIRRIGK